MLDEFSTPTFLVACLCGIGVCAIMAVVWLVSTRDPGDRSGAVKTDSDSQGPSKKVYRKKQFLTSKKKREGGGKDSGEEEEEVPPKSILKQPGKEDDEEEVVDIPVQNRPHRVEFHVETPPTKERVRTNPPTPYPSTTRKAIASEHMDPIPISEELKKPASKPVSAAAVSSSKPTRRTVQKSPPVAAPVLESVPVPAEEQPQQQPSSTKPSATKKSKSKPKQPTSLPGECIVTDFSGCVVLKCEMEVGC